MSTTVINSYAGGGGGGGTWYDLIDFSTTDTEYPQNGARAYYSLVPISLPAGTVTKLRVKVKDVTGSDQQNLAIYNASGNLVAKTGWKSFSANGTYEWAVISSAPISAGDYTLYATGYENAASYLPVKTFASGMAYCEYPNSPWRDIPATLPGTYSTYSGKIAVGVYVE